MLSYRFVLALLALLTLPISDIAAAEGQAKELLPGDAAPEVSISKWLRHGVYDSVRPFGSGDWRLTVLEFWGDWCPLARTVLPVHDRMQAGLKDQGVRFLAIAEGQQDSAQSTVKQLGLHSLSVAFDDGGTVFGRFVGSRPRMPMPFVVVIDETTGRVLWKGPAVTYEDSNAWKQGYTSRFEDTLATIISGQYDCDSARKLESVRADFEWLSTRIQNAAQSGQTRQLHALGMRALSSDWPKEHKKQLAEPMAIASWFVVSSAQSDPEQVADGLKLVEAAIEHLGEDNQALLHIHARALFENGQIEAALATQQRAVKMPYKYDGFGEKDLADALARYTEALAGQKATPEVKTSAPELVKTPEPPKEAARPSNLTSEQAASDLIALHDSLHLNYAAYDDIAWRLAAEQSSWRKHNDEFLARIRACKEWRACEFFDLVTEYLRVARDVHLNMTGTFERDGKSRTEQSRPACSAFPFFADVRVREQAGQMVIVQAPEDKSLVLGDVLIGVRQIGSPYQVRLGAVYLFPTVPLETAGAKDYLLGVLIDRASAPASIKVSISGDSGSKAVRDVELPIHRGRQEYDWQNKEAWSLEEKPVPVLTVRRLWGDGLEGLQDTASKLRKHPVSILDIRSNGGGNDRWAMDWVESFCPKSYVAYQGMAELRRGETQPMRRWDSWAGVTRGGDRGSSSAQDCGRLFVVTGVGCASSGETFTCMASQIPQAVLIGENTAGCVTYGNIDQSFTCPNAGFTVRFGRSRFAPGIRPVLECIGMFPDYWLDEPDPIAAVNRYCSLK